MRTKNVYVVEHFPYLTEKVAAITISKVYAKKHTAEVEFSEDYLECLRANDTTEKCPVYGNEVLDMYSYVTMSGEKCYARLREVPMIMD